MELIDFGKVLADQTRQEIMKVCCCQKLTVTEIVAKVNLTQPTISHHLKVLRNAGLVSAQRQGKEIYYTLNQNSVVNGCCQLANYFAPDIPLTVKPKDL